MFQIKENKITFKNTPIVLKGVSVADVNHIRGFRDFTFEEVLNRAIEEFNINTVRIPILPESECKDSWYDTPNYFEDVLCPAVQYATSKNLFVILDCHHICEFYRKPHFWNKNKDWNRKLKHDLMYFWDFLAKQYCKSEKIIFEIYNEPIGPDDWHRFKTKIANIMITVIRNHSNSLILVGFPSACDLNQIAEDPIYQKNVAYSTHLYPSFIKSGWKEKYKKICNKYPIVVVEWGFQKDDIIGGNNHYAEDVYSFASKEGISLISGFMDTQWEPSLLKEDLTLTDFGTFLKGKNL